MKLIIFLKLFLITIWSFSQNNSKYNRFKHISSLEGLSQNSVFCFAQDDLGRMWIGTRDGLNLYDGENITIFRTSFDSNNAISNNDIRSIINDSDGVLWIGTQKGLNSYNPVTQTFHNYYFDAEKNSVVGNQITAIAELDHGEIWIGTTNGLSIYNKKTKTFSNFGAQDLSTKGLTHKHITQIYEDASGAIWITTAAGLNLATVNNDGKLEFQHFFLEKTNNTGFFQTIVSNESTNLLWLGTKYNGLRFFDTNKKIFVPHPNQLEQFVKSKDVRCIKKDAQNRYWIATYNGLFVVENSKVITVTNQNGNPKSLTRNTLKTIYIDNQDTVWIGAYYGGVNLWNQQNQYFEQVYNLEEEQAKPLGVVSCIEEDNNNNLYFGSESQGITVFDAYRKLNKTTTEILNTKLSKANIKSIFVDDSKLWIATYDSGLHIFDLNENKFVPVQKVFPQLSKTLKTANLYDIARVDDFYFFASFDKGLVVFNKANNQISTLRTNRNKTNMLTSDRVKVLLVDGNKNLWIGTESGLNQIPYSQIENGKLAVNRFLFDDEKYYGNDITSLLKGEAGQIFIGTREKGLFELRDSVVHSINLETSTDVITNVNTVVSGKNSELWITSNKGVLKYDQSQRKVEVFNDSEALVGQEFHNNSGILSADGKVYFGGIFGAISFSPSLKINDAEVPKVVLTQLKMGGAVVTHLDKNNAVLNQNIAFTKDITLTHNQTSFSLNFALPNYFSTSENKYKYRLKGFDDNWKYTTSSEVNYSLNQPGEFVFEVAAAAANAPVTSLKVKVNPAPWKSAYAFALYFVLLALALYGLNYVKESRSKLNYQLELKQQEKEQLAALNKSKLEFFTNISHEFRTPLSLILGPLQQVMEEYEGSNKIYKKLQVIQQNGNQLLQLINQLLDFRKFENKNSKLQAAEGNLVKFLKEIYLSFREYSKIGKYEYQFISPVEELEVYFDRYKLERVFYNLISNAFKYTPEGGKIIVEIIPNDKNVSVAIKDNGRGIDKKFVGQLFDRFYEVAAGKDYQKQFNQSSGIGLSIAKKAVDLHQGTIEVLENDHPGTVFMVTLPLGKAHLKTENILTNFKKSDDISLYQKQVVTPTAKEIGISLKENKADLPTILVAEDNDELRNFIEELLSNDYNVITASNGKRAFKKALQYLPDLIISDVIMPEMEGTEFCAKAKSDIRTSHIPFILLTSRTSLVYKLDGLESGADAYINKPFDVKEFTLSVQNILSVTSKIKQKFTGENVVLENNATTNIDEQLLQKAIGIVKSNMENTSFNIPTFSAELGVSRTVLFAKIKKLTNLTPNEFIHSIRMKRAAELLELGQINVSEICYKVGFKDPKYFTKCFKKHFKQTPTDYAAKFYL